MTWGDVAGGLLGGLVAVLLGLGGVVGLGAWARKHFARRG